MMELYALHALNTNDSSNANCGKRNKMSKKDKEILSLMVFLIVLFQIVTVIYASKRVQSGKTTTKTADILVSISTLGVRERESPSNTNEGLYCIFVFL